jgi:molybdenum cofactor biosynthesis enzyme MoaA
MRSERVLTNLRCNQSCTFCNSRSSSDERSFIQASAVRARIEAAHRSGARELVLTGGEPTLRNDITALVAYARELGVERVVLETNGTLIGEALADGLKQAGVVSVRVNVSGLADPLDAVTRDPGGATRTLAGIRALMEARVPVELDVAVVTSTLAGLPDLPERLASELGDLSRIDGLRVRVPVDGHAPAELVDYETAASAISAMEDHARRVELQLLMAPDSGPPPCVFKRQVRVAHLFSLTPGGTRRSDLVRVEACRQCEVSDRCGGLASSYLARHAPPAMEPIREERLRRRLSLVGSTREQMRREFVTVNRRETVEGVEIEKIIRINFHCNQSCRFCFVSTHLPSESDEAVRAAIVQAGEEGASIVLSGGEPTLHPRLVEFVALAKAHSTKPVMLQTNATRLGGPDAVPALVAAGLHAAFISLHGSTAALSDAITEAPGTFEKTVAGIDAVARTPLYLIINFVICQQNMDDLVPFIRFVASRWPRAITSLSFVAASSDVVPREGALIPRYSEALPQIAAAVTEAARLGVTVSGFESMCGLPLCLVPTELTRYLDLSNIPEGFDGGEFVKTATCERCALVRKCYGIRRGYRELHGDSELRAVGADRPADLPMTA